eukprot:CAMPEP_0183309734 /NCGR_PEP_ID=MMETSP0160_2-20130417/25514_1 /TAXON_ID=2839 ORGANISM="Odontella Sinensis, Strain Grunow 1884" /NCGR_SAMPLE_ID=MMETSP0160_2 /ASSEMBLY_ACC=CAM_ASM_000250 /LENGTH=249 /DNA_ID=CAMNT_0025473803 /DNA_START=113 /DNA_END=862 /DNA_ORIENTATION=-
MGIEIANILRNATLCLLFAFGSHVALTPQGSAKTYGFKPILRKGTVAHLFWEGCGYIALSHALCVYISSQEGSSFETSVGLGLALRLFWITKSILLKSFTKAGVDITKIEVVTGIGYISTYSLLWGKGSPTLAAGIMSCLLGLCALFLFTSPSYAEQFILGARISKQESPFTMAILRYFGKINLMNASFMAALTFGVEPMKAFGLCEIVWSVADMYDFILGHNIALGNARSTNLITSVMAAATAYGTLS